MLKFRDFVNESIENNLFVVYSQDDDLISVEKEDSVTDMLIDDWKKATVSEIIGDGFALSSDRADQILQRGSNKSNYNFKKVTLSEFMKLIKSEL